MTEGDHYHLKQLRLAPLEVANALGIPGESPVFISSKIDKPQRCGRCGVIYGCHLPPDNVPMIVGVTQQRFPGPVPRYCGAWCRFQHCRGGRLHRHGRLVSEQSPGALLCRRSPA